MKKNLYLVTLLLIAVMLGAVPLTALADTVMPPRDYVKETEDGQYVFVMLAPEQWGRYGRTDIRKTYRQSGLYKNDGSATPLWTVDWYSYTVYPSSDGRHLVEMGPWASDTNELAVAFHRDGKLIKAYAIKDLVRDTARLRHTVSHFFWRKSLEYDDRHGFLSLTTTDGRSYRFSIRTGEIEAQGNETESSPPQGKGPRSEEQREEKIVLSDPVHVTASIIEARPPAKGIGRTYDIDVTVRKDAEKFVLRTYLVGVGSADQAFDAVKKGTRWEGSYLLVRTECGGGNAWRCNRDAVFAVKADRLLSLGEVFAGDRKRPASSYRNGCFWDVYDKFETNELTDHVNAPAFWLAVAEKGGTFNADPARTWLRNRQSFKDRTAEIRVFAQQKQTGRSRHERLESLVLTNAVLAKYCGRKEDAAAMERLAAQYLQPARLAVFRNILLHVEPGEYPLIHEG